MKTGRDIKALKGAIESLKRSSGKNMLHANLRFIWDYFIDHPSKELPDHLKEKEL